MMYIMKNEFKIMCIFDIVAHIIIIMIMKIAFYVIYGKIKWVCVCDNFIFESFALFV